MIQNAKKYSPWWLKILLKIIISRLPFQYEVWQKLGIFRLGRMDEISFVTNAFFHHISRFKSENNFCDNTILEIGPGDSVGTAIIAASIGSKSILVDIGAYATQDVSFYKNLARQLSFIGLEPPDLLRCRDLFDVLRLCNARYLVNGLKDLKQIESNSVDFIFSQVVLQHIRRSEFSETLCETFRILRDTGVSSHSVDLRDHLGGSLNNLRFSDRLWESRLFSRSGFYTNRIRYQEMLEIFETCGFDAEVVDIQYWDEIPIARSKLDRRFSTLMDEDLRVKSFDVLLRCRKN